MKTTLPPRHPRARAFGRLLGAMFGVWMLGAAYTPAVAATAPQPWMGAAPEPAPAAASTSAPASSSTVTVDQQPLTVQPTIPPNIMLMLDDSGSMAWDYMPDWGYLIKNSDGTFSSPSNNDQPRNASINGVYYNPATTYTPPPKADSTTAKQDLYPDSPGLTNAYKDGFSDTTASDEVDITKYTGGNNSYASTFPYYTRFTVTITTTYAAGTGGVTTTTYSCPSGSTSDGNYPPTCYSCPNNYSLRYSRSNGYYCYRKNYSNVTPTQPAYLTTTTYSCNSGDTPSGNVSSDTTCTHSTTSYKYYFTYTTGSGNTRHYVGTTGTCALLPTASPAVTDASLCDDSAATQQNVANWFSYYHTRILMAKSGLMTAFSTVDPTYRVGFGSINNHGSSAITSLGSSNYKKYNSQYIAYVQPFGDGSSGTQKSNFWNWAVSISPNDGTPLPSALDAVGQYYQNSSQPWSTMSTDPTYGKDNASTPIACRQAYTILTTDGFWNSELSSSSATDGASSSQWPAITGPNNQSWPTVANSSPAAPYSGGATDDGSPSLADVAMYYWENDLRSSVSNEVPPSTDDPAFWQHMTTFTMGMGFTPSDAKGNAIDSTAVFNWANGGTQPSNWGGWPTPSIANQGSINNIADLAHAAVNGHGGFYSATSPQTFAGGLTDALKRATARAGTGASLAANSTQLTTGTVAYQAKYETSKWYGDLAALAIDSSTGAISSSCTSTGSWCADTVLASSSSSGTYPDRTVVTYVPPTAWAVGGGSFVAFKNSGSTPPSLSSSQLSALGSDATAQANMVNYLRGDNTLEQSKGGTYRNRDYVLGDIVDSQPVYSGAPNPNEFEGESFTGISNSASSGDNSFQAFAVGTTSGTTATASAASTRTPLVFVAANDGMLHAFKASDGSEQYAYLPGAVITAGLSNLANTDYGTTTAVPHQYYNDGELTIADVFFSSAWHTVLVGTTGRGLAKTIYALDITNPASITPLWERSAGDGGTNADYIGQMVGKPVIAQVADGNWQVLIGNGYNSTNGTAALLEFSVADGTLSVHTTDSTVANGLAAPVTWMDDASNGISTEAYAGDLQGRVWEFPLDTATTTTASDGTTTTTHTADLTTAGTKEFTADSGGTVQPITAGMLAGRDPVTGNVWVFFGTGQYLTSTDLTNKQVQSWYGLIVQDGKNQPDLPDLPTDTQSGDLVQRSITYEQDGDSTATPPTLSVRTVTTLPTPSDMSGKRGWYMDLEQPVTGTDGSVTGHNAQGERMVTPNQFQGNLLLGTTRIPDAATNSDICNSSGTGWVMAVDPFTGTNPSASFFLVNGGTGTVNVTVGGKTVAVPIAGVGFTSLPNNPIFVGGDMLMSFDNGTTSNVDTSGASGVPSRVSWQELVNP